MVKSVKKLDTKVYKTRQSSFFLRKDIATMFKLSYICNSEMEKTAYRLPTDKFFNNLP